MRRRSLPRTLAAPARRARRIALIASAVAFGAAAAAAAPRLTLEGPLVQGGLIRGHVAPPDSTLRLDGRPVAVRPDGRFVIGFGRDQPPRALLRAEGAGGVVERPLAIAARSYETQRIDGLPARMVAPEPAAQARIRAEQDAVRAARARHSDLDGFLEDFSWPVVGIITGVYGSARILNGAPRAPHYGIDIAAPAGTPVVAPASGRVTLVHPDMYYSGATLVLDHGQGVSSSFLHLERIVVAEGQRLAAGQRLATVGSSGRSTGAHLDWRVNWRQVRIDPQLLAGPMPEATP